MDKTVLTGKQIAEFLQKVGPEDAAAMMCGIRQSIGDAAEEFADTLTKLQHTYPELIAIFGLKVQLTVSDKIRGEMINFNLGVNTTEKLMDLVHKGIKSKEIKEPADLVDFLQNQIAEILQSGSDDINYAESGPTVFLVIGVNGAGKTTTIGKMANYYKSFGMNVMLAAADTFRAAAIDQLQVWGERTGCPVIAHQEGSDPAAVAYDAVKAAVARKVDVLLIDTAGRLQTKANLMEELKKINRVIDREIPGAPHETLLVLDASSGQNAISQAQLFTKAAPISGIVLTKLDGTAKGGVVIGIKSELSMPVKWIGVGEGIDDLRPFVAKDFAKALLGKEELSKQG